MPSLFQTHSLGHLGDYIPPSAAMRPSSPDQNAEDRFKSPTEKLLNRRKVSPAKSPAHSPKHAAAPSPLSTPTKASPSPLSTPPSASPSPSSVPDSPPSPPSASPESPVIPPSSVSAPPSEAPAPASNGAVLNRFSAAGSVAVGIFAAVLVL
ncbi:classical arabinogalactan protein 1 [Prunus yedoensis var. nudiflora]|uniref:Classical arabinogalactan protein 1 n=1 Tax=Prunus yedoensis var. nudiflora TaxID=2094558 RepID=A0A314ZE75_PRUYE|nr:classical arabinogalactan protein 1 [Prunus yedoensis var. nudiflora]